MTPAARYASAIDIIDAWLTGVPLETAYQGWQRRARYAGSSDRAAIRDIVFDAARRRLSYAAMGGAETGRGILIGALRAAGVPVSDVFSGHGHAPAPLTQTELGTGREPAGAEALDIRDWLIPRMERALGTRCETVLTILRDRAPVHLRVNTLNADPEQVIGMLAEAGVEAEPHPTVRTAVTVTANPRQLARSGVVEQGLAELQDASSQRVILRLCKEPATRILDYCAGAGGKSLALADLSDAAIVAHDIEPARMADLPERARRAGAEITLRETAELERDAPFDLVLCDAPCSGSGTWRRDVEGKWRLTPERLSELVAQQRDVLRSGAAPVAPGGRLAYVTCSVLLEENEDQVAHFLAEHPDWTEIDGLRIDPTELGDGFFLAVLRRG